MSERRGKRQGLAVHVAGVRQGDREHKRHGKRVEQRVVSPLLTCLVCYMDAEVNMLSRLFTLLALIVCTALLSQRAHHHGRTQDEDAKSHPRQQSQAHPPQNGFEFQRYSAMHQHVVRFRTATALSLRLWSFYDRCAEAPGLRAFFLYSPFVGLISQVESHQLPGTASGA